MAPGAPVSELAAPFHGVSALDGLYESHAPDLRRRCLRLTRDGHAADDLMQEVFVRFLSRFPQPPIGMNVGAYLHATARNVLWKQLRDSHEIADGDIETTVGADDDLDNDPERSALLGEQQGLVRRCAAMLTGRQRRALTMRDVEGRSYGEIGSELGLGTGAVMQVISRARARLRVAVRRANIDLDALAPECRAMLGPLSDYLDGRAASTEADIEAHLATCDSCCRTLASFQDAGSRLRGFLPLVPLGGMLSRLRGSHGGRTPMDALLPAATHAPMLARVGSMLGGSGDGALGATGVGALATAAVIAIGGGGIVAAHEMGSASRHALVATTVKAKVATPAAGLRPLATTPADSHATLLTPSHAHSYSPSFAVLAASGPAGHARARTTVARTHTRAHATPTRARPSVDATPGGGAGPRPATTPARAPIVTTPAVVAPDLTTPATVPAVEVPGVIGPVTTTPSVTTPPVTVPPPPVVPPVHIPALPLGSSASFAVLAGSGVTNTGPTQLTGDLGSFPTPAITGLASLSLTGANQGGSAVAQQAKTDLVAGYDAAVAKTSTSTIAADLGGRTLEPGIYRSASSIGLTGTVTLDAQGDQNAVFIFQAGSTLTTASASQVVLINGALACNVFWQVGSSATLGTGSTLRGSILALVSVTVTTGVTIDGRVLARNGAVTLDSDTITGSDC
jgi:RNA polymerase sigma factor (sigma-70 family)